MTERMKKAIADFETAKKANAKAAAAEKAAKAKAKETTAVLMAAGANAATAAAAELLEAITEAPEKFNIPTHYKKFKAAVFDVIPENYFYIDCTEYSFRIVFKPGHYNHNDCYVCSKKNGYIEIENAAKRAENMPPVVTLSEIRKEAKQARKDAEKLRAAAEKLEAEARKNIDKYSSYIKYLMPRVEVQPIKDNYRLF